MLKPCHQFFFLEKMFITRKLLHSRIISLRIDLRLPEGCKCIYQTRLYLWAGNYRVYLSWQLTITTWFHRFLRIFRCDQSYIDTTYTGEAYIANRTHRTVIMSPKPPQTYCICSVSSYYYYSFFLSFFLSSAKSLPDTFLDDYWTEINETSEEC